MKQSMPEEQDLDNYSLSSLFYCCSRECTQNSKRFQYATLACSCFVVRETIIIGTLNKFAHLRLLNVFVFLLLGHVFKNIDFLLLSRSHITFRFSETSSHSLNPCLPRAKSSVGYSPQNGCQDDVILVEDPA